VTGALRTVAPAKVNLCLYAGPRRADGLHELVSVFQPLDLADELTLEPAARDEVVCPGVEGENLAERALRAYRDVTGNDEAHRLTIAKRIPVAAGLGGGSGDAAATLRLAAHAAGAPDDPRLHDLATALGSDVPALLHETPTLVTGVGEEVTPLAGPALAGEVAGGHRSAAGEGAGADWSAAGGPAGGFVYVLLPSRDRLTAAAVYAEADRRGAVRPADALAVRRAEVEAAIGAGGLPLELVHNDLQDAARALCPAIDDALAAARDAGAVAALVSGSGPTVFALFRDRAAAETLAQRWPGGILAGPAPRGLTEVRAA
jgi:4-diphosphocytidyl-2-C-methyl-D-erythritol kinase